MTTVLVVDDEPTSARSSSRYLEREGYRTLEAADGDRARELARARAARPRRPRPDASRNGRPRALPLDPRRSELPVIMLTARGEEADRIVGLELGADDYVTKPFSPRELVARVRTRAAPRSTPSAAPRTARVRRRSRSTPRTREVTKAARELRLTAQGVRPALVPRQPPAPCLLARPADATRVGLLGRARHRHRHRPRAPAPREDRGRPVPPAASGDGLGRRLQVLAVIALAVLVALATLAVGLVAALACGCCRRVRLQLAGLALARRRSAARAVLLSGWVMFHMGDDVKILAVAAASASAALVAALLVARPIARRIERLRRRVGGARAAAISRARAPEQGPAELAELARSFNEMADEPLSGSSTRAASSSPGRATTCARRSPRCRRCSRRSRTDSPSLSATCRRCASRCGRSRRLVDDLFELARIDAGALDARAARGRARRPRRVVPAGRRGGGARAQHVQLEARVDGGAAGALRARPGRARALQPADERAAPHAGRRLGRGAGRAASREEVRVVVEDTGEGLRPRQRARDVRALLARRQGADERRAAPASGWRSRAASSRRTAAGSGPRIARGRHARLLHAARGGLDAVTHPDVRLDVPTDAVRGPRAGRACRDDVDAVLRQCISVHSSQSRDGRLDHHRLAARRRGSCRRPARGGGSTGRNARRPRGATRM